MREKGFTDLHHHILWGMDDGPKTPEQMHAMLEMAVRDGIERIAATSHAYPRMRPFDMDQYLARLAEANQYCQQQGWTLRLFKGCEIHYCDRVPDLLRAGKLPTLGKSRMVLIEFDPDESIETICQASDKLYRAGYRPIVAHVERCHTLVRSPRNAMDIREEYGLIFQMNCATVLHPRGIWERIFVRKMLTAQAIDVIATDAHDTQRRPVCMNAAYQKLLEQYGERYACRLVQFGRRNREQNEEEVE